MPLLTSRESKQSLTWLKFIKCLLFFIISIFFIFSFQININSNKSLKENQTNNVSKNIQNSHNREVYDNDNNESKLSNLEVKIPVDDSIDDFNNNLFDQDNFAESKLTESFTADAKYFITGENVSGTIGYSLSGTDLTIIPTGTTTIKATNPTFKGIITDMPDQTQPYKLTGFSNFNFTFASKTIFEFKGVLTIPDSVINIGNNVFASNYRNTLNNTIYNEVSEVYLPESLTALGSSAFRLCPLLKTVHLPSSLKNLAGYTFSGCTSLNNINIDNITSIEASAFTGCIFEQLAFNKSIEKIGQYAFAGCNKLKKINLSQCTNDISIERSTFENCFNLEEVILNDELTSIPGDCFAGCTNLKLINLDNITSIGDNAFNVCKNLQNININHLISIGISSFSGCTNLTTVKLPQTLTTISAECFQDCLNLKSINLQYVSIISEDAFYNCSKLNEINFLNISQIDMNAFFQCKITNINLPDDNSYYKKNQVNGGGYVVLNKSSFPDEWDYQTPPTGCLAYGDIKIPESVEITEITDSLFFGCGGLTSIDLSNCTSLTSIRSNAFYNCTGLTSVDLSKCTNLTAIDDYAFENCSGLTLVSLPNTLKSIGQYAFGGCPIKQVNFEGNDTYKWVNNVGQGHLLSTSDKWDYQTSPVGSIAYGDIDMSALNDYEIQKYLFANCTGITSINLPNSVYEIGIAAFWNCINLKSINLNHIYNFQEEHSIINDPGVFYGCTNLKSISLNKVDSIPEHTFAECISLESIVFPEKPFNIFLSSFIGCSNIHSITFKCKGEDLTYLALTNKIDQEWLLNAVGSDKMSNVTVHVPAKQKVEYEKYAQQLGIQGCNIVEGSNPIDNDLPLILGLSLGLGIPTIAGIITGTTISIKNYKIKTKVNI